MASNALEQAGFLDGLDAEEAAELVALVGRRSLEKGEYLFLLGDDAEYLYIVSKGTVDLCFPMSFGETVKDVAMASMAPGRAIGWSSLVEPFRFAFAARASEPSEVFTLPRTELFELFDVRPHIGYLFSLKLSQIIGRRLLRLQALWTRELQRSIAKSLESGQPLPDDEASRITAD